MAVLEINKTDWMPTGFSPRAGRDRVRTNDRR